MAYGKPIQIVRVTGGFNVFVRDVPVVFDPKAKTATIDRVKAGIAKGRKKYPDVPESWQPALFVTAEEVQRVAHMIGRYMMSLGDFVSGYTSVVGIDDPDEFWEDSGEIYDRRHGLSR